MALLPPPDHLPTSVAVLHLIASILHDESNRTGKDPRLPQRMRPVARLRNHRWPTVSTYDMVSIGFTITEHPDHPRDPFRFGGVQVTFELRIPPQPRRRLPKGALRLKPVGLEPEPPMTLTLRPPYADCLSRAKLKANLSRGLRDIEDPIPEGSVFDFPDFAVSVGAKFRHALAQGALRTILVDEETGQVVDLPPDFWRTHDAEVALAQDAPVSFRFSHKTAHGHVYIAIAEMQRGWRSVVEPAAPVPEPLMTAPLPSPWMAFQHKVAAHFGYSGGRTTRNTRYTKKEIQDYIKDTWPEEFGLFSASAASFLARFIRHPDDEALGKPDASEERAIRRRKAEALRKDKVA